MSYNFVMHASAVAESDTRPYTAAMWKSRDSEQRQRPGSGIAVKVSDSVSRFPAKCRTCKLSLVYLAWMHMRMRRASCIWERLQRKHGHTRAFKITAADAGGSEQASLQARQAMQYDI